MNRKKGGRKPKVRPAAYEQEGTLAYRLRQARAARDWSQHRLAEAAGTSQAVIQKIENGYSRQPRILMELAEALGTTPAWLLFGEGEERGLSSEALALARAWQALPDGEEKEELRRSVLVSAAMQQGGRELVKL